MWSLMSNATFLALETRTGSTWMQAFITPVRKRTTFCLHTTQPTTHRPIMQVTASTQPPKIHPLLKLRKKICCCGEGHSSSFFSLIGQRTVRGYEAFSADSSVFGLSIEGFQCGGEETISGVTNPYIFGTAGKNVSK